MEPPIYVFDKKTREFERRYRIGLQAEEAFERAAIESYNDRQIEFACYPIDVLAEADASRSGRAIWLFFVDPTTASTEGARRFPSEGENLDMLFKNKNKYNRRANDAGEIYTSAERVDNPAAAMGLTNQHWQKFAAFKVYADGNPPWKSFLDQKGNAEQNNKYESADGLARRLDRVAMTCVFRLSYSAATTKAELGALNMLTTTTPMVSPRQRFTFHYLLSFKDAEFEVDLLDEIPHMKDPLRNKHGLPKRLAELFGRFDSDQQKAYHSLTELECGVKILPGGPGSGKTHFNLVCAALAQARPFIRDAKWDTTGSPSMAKVLYLLDINKPLNDVSAKLVSLYNSVGMKKRAIRLFAWRYQTNKGVCDWTRGFLNTAQMMKRRRGRPLPRTLAHAPTLDEMAWQVYSENPGLYSDLAKNLPQVLQDPKKNTLIFKVWVDVLYRDLWAQIDTIFCTPVTASHGFSKLWEPDLIMFDESAHAKESSLMISVAHFCPIAWFFTGDFRQTRPFVGDDNNPQRLQMQTSTMERAAHAKAIKCELLVNHRAYGNLLDLGSHLFYNKRLTSGIPESQRFPPSVLHLRDQYLSPLVAPAKLSTPRLIVSVAGAAEQQSGTSFYNPAHVTYVAKVVQRLVADRLFKGDIMIISPYREQVVRYKAVMRALQMDRVDVRTIDTVQGGEASVVFFDMTRELSTAFNNEAHRLTVSLTRAREAEIIIMHEKLARERVGHIGRLLGFYKHKQQAPIALVSPETGLRLPDQPGSHVQQQQQQQQQQKQQHQEDSSGLIDNGAHRKDAAAADTPGVQSRKGYQVVAPRAASAAGDVADLVDLIDLDAEGSDDGCATNIADDYFVEPAAVDASTSTKSDRPLNQLFAPMVPAPAPVAMDTCIHRLVYIPATEDSALQHAAKQIRKVSDELQQEIDEQERECGDDDDGHVLGEAAKVAATDETKTPVMSGQVPGQVDLLSNW